MSIQIKHFDNKVFGGLTIIHNDHTGNYRFLTKEICEMFGHTNVTKAISDAGLDKTEKETFNRKEHPKFIDQLRQNNLIAKRGVSISLITESGLYKLIMASRKENALPFKNWVAQEVLPSIRKTGSYSIGQALSDLDEHRHIENQKQHSKDVNAVMHLNGGKNAIINYNRKSCKLHTGFTTTQVKDSGKLYGLPSKDRQSAKQVLRQTRPELACAMSFTDKMVSNGGDLDQWAKLSISHAAPLFKAILESGFTPNELNK